ncbi:MAG TPA: type VI secretion system baseplate subunit TssE [Gemmatimonadales bacterium]|nr:type VI secretion system baseplate subunit TssE [Gemmatimonadales bacterium]
MKHPGLDRSVRGSVLDRLIDERPRDTAEVPPSWTDSVRDLKIAVRRDLEWLLNTRRIAEPAPEAYEELNRSLYHYGFPDITSLGRDARDTRTRLVRRIEETLALHEPRLAGVRVTLAETEADNRRQLRFLIEALLRMEPNPEQVAFDTVLEIASGEYHVKGGGGA